MSKIRKNKTWEERYIEVLKYKKNYNKLPTQIKNSDDKHRLGLAVWIKSQRIRCKLGKLPEEKVGLLNLINIDWNRKEQADKNWEKTFVKIIEFRRKNSGKWPTSHTDDKDEKSLALWCEYNRSRNKGTLRRLNKYPKDRKQKLDSIGFLWGHDQRWHQMYEELKIYRKENLRRWPPIKMKKLYNWIRAQRIAYRNGLLPPKRIALLNKLNFEWNPEKRKYY